MGHLESSQEPSPGPSCPAPLRQFTPVSFEVPAQACDTHAHVVHPDTRRYPPIAERSYTPPPASESDYLSMLDQLGLQRGVLVQISTYGTDNRCLLEVLARHPGRLRGVAVVDRSVTQAELQRMHAAGVRGLRLNTLLKGGVGYALIEDLAERIAPLGWHLQFLMHVRDLPALLPRMARLPVPCVIDHMGDQHVDEPLDGPGFEALCTLLREHGGWAKLSGAYRLGVAPDALEDTTAIAHRLIAAAPERVLWGSDWPHVNVRHMPDTGQLLNLLAHWVPDAALRRRILVDNPARLYGFAD